MKVHVLGCGDAFGSGGRNQSGYLVEASDRLFLLDCGPTTLLAMKRAGFDPRRLDAVFLSHLHGDHFAGLPFFFIEYLHENPRDEPLDVAGPPGAEERILQLYGLMYGEAGPKAIPARFHILLPEQSTTVNGIQIYPFRVPHQVNEISLALKVSYEGKQLLFSGDSAWTDLFITHARGVDLFLCECCFYDQTTPNHMNYLKLKEVLPRLECERIVLTHLGEAMLARRRELEVTCAEDGMIIQL
ncbi:MAG TPA: MBL fold metallo-hydrolase [Candidatus Binatia bacterium]|nr:MBL fold metallo-hydrolase [Candidatus Binatia bacterium]